MTGFLYFVADAKSITVSELRVHGLGYIFDQSNRKTAGTCASGPDGHQGMIVSDPARVSPDRSIYAPAEQTWLRIPASLLAEGAPAIYVGYWTATPPGPEDLARAVQLRGHAVRLGDGRDWNAPAGRCWVGDVGFACACPQTSRLNDDGEWTVGEVEAFYRPLWEIAFSLSMEVENARQEGADYLQLEFGDIHARALTCLQANYVLGPVECSMLGLLGLASANKVLEASMDLPTLKDWLKKKGESAGVNTSPGEAA